MRQSQFLHSASLSLFLMVFAGCCQPLLELVTFPTLFSAILVQVLGPIPRCVPSVGPLLPERHRPPRLGDSLVTPEQPPQCSFYGENISGLQSFADVQAPALAWPPGCTHRSTWCWAARQ